MNRMIRTLRMAIVTALLAGATLGGPLVATAGADTWSTPTSEAPAGVRDSVVRLYQATLDREPDDAGRDYWVGLYLDGLPLSAIAQHFMDSPEWHATYDEVDDARFVELLYANVFHRPPDEDGARYWQEKLREGYPRTTLLLSFSESTEFVSDTGTAPPEPPPPLPWPTIPADSGQGRRIIYANGAQRIWIVGDDGRIAHSHLVSGKAGVPNPGTYAVFSKSELAWAGHDGITMQWMVRFAHGDRYAIGFHAIPRRSDGTPIQSESELGSYRSAGCVRQADVNAKILYDWAQIGDTVVVLR